MSLAEYCITLKDQTIWSHPCVRLVYEGETLLRLDFFEESGMDTIPENTKREKTPFTDLVCRELSDYLLGEKRAFSFAIEMRGTPFQKKVWTALLAIPYGKTATYQEIATAIGNPNGARAVGMACHRNPLMVVVPCHRVIGSNGKLTGYAGGLELKKKLLALENAPIPL